MSVSNNTVNGLATLLRKYVAPDKLPKLLTELESVPGNQAFRLAVVKLIKEMRAASA